MKVCTKCGEKKPLSEFYSHPTNRDRLFGQCRTCCAEYRRRWNKTPNGKLCHRRWRLKRYGITIEEFERRFAEQGRVCVICGNGARSERKYHAGTTVPLSFHVDHCHGSGAVRGILCMKCNQGLGGFRDDPELLVRAAEYLLRFARHESAGQEQNGQGHPDQGGQADPPRRPGRQEQERHPGHGRQDDGQGGGCEAALHAQP